MAVNTFSIGGANSIRGAAVSTAVRQPTLGPALGQLGAAAFDTAKVLKAERQENDRRRDALTSAGSLSNARIKMEEETAKLDPTAEDYENRLDAALAGARDDALATAELTDDDARAQLELDLERNATAHKLTSIVTRRDALEDQALLGRGQASDRTLAAILDDPDGYDAHLVQFGQDATRYNQSIRPDRLAALNEQFGDAALLAKIEGLANGGRYSEARAILKEHEGEFDPAKAREAGRLVHQIEDQKKRDLEERGSYAASDAEVAIYSAGDVQTLAAIRQRTEELYRNGLISPAKRAELHRRAEVRQRTIATESKGLNEAAAKITNNLGLDSREEANRYYEKVVEPGLASLEPGQRAEVERQTSLLFARRSGFVDPRTVSLMARAEGIDNPQQLQDAASRVAALREHAPAAMARQKPGPRVEATLAYHRAYAVPFDQAAQMVIADAQRAPEVFERHAEEFKALAVPGEDLIRGVVSDADPWFSSDPVVPPEAEADAEAAYRAAYLRSGNAEQARAQAETTIKQRYQVTNVGGGDPIVMEMAPEQFAPVEKDLAVKLIDTDVHNKIVAAGLTIPPAPAGMEGSPGYKLKADGQTRIEAPTRHPSWQLWLRDEAGAYHRAMAKNADGQEEPARYTMPDGSEVKDILPEAFGEKKAEAEEAAAGGRARIDRSREFQLNQEIQAEMVRLRDAPKPRDRSKLDALIAERDAANAN